MLWSAVWRYILTRIWKALAKRWEVTLSQAVKASLGQAHCGSFLFVSPLWLHVLNVSLETNKLIGESSNPWVTRTFECSRKNPAWRKSPHVLRSPLGMARRWPYLSICWRSTRASNIWNFDQHRQPFASCFHRVHQVKTPPSAQAQPWPTFWRKETRQLWLKTKSNPTKRSKVFGLWLQRKQHLLARKGRELPAPKNHTQSKSIAMAPKSHVCCRVSGLRDPISQFAWTLHS